MPRGTVVLVVSVALLVPAAPAALLRPLMPLQMVAQAEPVVPAVTVEWVPVAFFRPALST
jgi:hypothetical protein